MKWGIFCSNAIDLRLHSLSVGEGDMLSNIEACIFLFFFSLSFYAPSLFDSQLGGFVL